MKQSRRRRGIRRRLNPVSASSFPLSDDLLKSTVISSAFGSVGLMIHHLYPHAFDFMFRPPNPDAPENATEDK